MQQTDTDSRWFPFTELREAVDRSIGDWLADGGDDPLAVVHRWALSPPGKLVRPLLLLTSAGAVGGRYEQVMPAAVGIELSHAASLVHDDIIDDDDVRRGRAAVHHRFGVSQAVLGADSLFFALFQQLGECRRRGVPDRLVVEAMEVLGAAGRQITRGVAHEITLSGQLSAAGDPGADILAAYTEMARLKCAALLRAACHVGALLGGGTPRQTQALGDYGEALGIAFQIHDDLLPYKSGWQGAGKPDGSDLRNQRPALPLLLAYRLGSPADRAALTEQAGGTGDDAERQRRLSRLVRASGALREADSMAQSCIARCRRALGAVPSGADRDRLSGLAGLFTGESDDADRPVGAGAPEEAVNERRSAVTPASARRS